MPSHFSANRKLILLTTLFGIMVSLSLWLSYSFLDNRNLVSAVLAHLPQGNLGFVSLFIILSLGTSLGLPRQVAAFSAGFMFDIINGTLLATTAAIIGCLLTMLFSRIFLSKVVALKYPQPLNNVSLFFRQRTFVKTLIIRCLPAGSNLLTNILAGVAKVPLRPYLAASTLGFLPQMFIFSMMGNGVKLADQQQLVISSSLFIVAALLTAYLYKRSPKNQPH